MEEEKTKYKAFLCETMKYFIEICEKHGFQYYACAGTCLGAIRHKGMIPWDDDIDVLMPRNDYERFIKLKSKLAGTGYEIIDFHNPCYNQPFAKFSNANTTIVEETDFPIVLGVYIDIFPLDEVGDIEIAESLHNKKNKYFEKYRGTFRKIRLHACIDLIAHMHIKTLLHFLFYASMGKKMQKYFLEKYLQTEDCIQKQKGSKCMCYGGFYGFKKELCEKTWFGKGVKVPFEDFFITIPESHHAYLTHFYNDYMTPPPLQYRVSHHSRYFVDLNKRWDIRDVLKIKGIKHQKMIQRYEE